MNEMELFLMFLECVRSRPTDGQYDDKEEAASIFEKERRRFKSELNRLSAFEKIVDNWKKHSNDFKKQICAVDPAPATGKTRLWLDNNSYKALNNFLSQYSTEYRKRNNSFGGKRIFIANRKIDKNTALHLTYLIEYHLASKIDLGIVFKEDIETLIPPEFYNGNVIPGRISTNAQYIEENEEHPLLIIDKKEVIKDTYDAFRLLNKKAIKFNNNDLRLSMRSLDVKKRERITLPAPLKFYIYLRDGGVCTECGTDVGLQFDHIYPHSLGGSNNTDNFQILCGECNRKKSNKI